MAERPFDAIRTFITSVSAVADVHHRLRRVTLTGPDLAEFDPLGPDTYLYFLLPPPGRNELTVDRSFRWSQVPEMAPEDRPVGGYYTLWDWRPEGCELDVLMVLHGDTGPAGAWAERVTVGDPVALWGPRTAYHPPADTDSMLLVADDTGLPALATILDLIGDTMPVTAVIEVGAPDEQIDLPVAPTASVYWTYRGEAEPGTTSLLADCVRALDPPGIRPYVWGGGESRAMTAVRRHVRDQWGLTKEAVSLMAYWRHASSPPDPD